jgi:hypothetical protein
MADVFFHGNYSSDITEGSKPNPMYEVDFSEATFGQYVVFNDCDLSTCTPPSGSTFDSLLKSTKEPGQRMTD